MDEITQERFTYSGAIAFIICTLTFFFAVSSASDIEPAPFGYFASIFAAIIYAGLFGAVYAFIRTKSNFPLDIETFIDPEESEKEALRKQFLIPVGVTGVGILMLMGVLNFLGIYYHTLPYIFGFFNSSLMGFIFFVVYHLLVSFTVIFGAGFIEARKEQEYQQKAEHQARIAEQKAMKAQQEAEERRQNQQLQAQAKEEERQCLALEGNIQTLSQHIDTVTAKNSRLTQEIRTLERIVSGLDIFDDDFLDNYPKVLQYIDEEYEAGRAV